MLKRLRFGIDKVRWGVRAVGAGAAARGSLRLLSLRLRRPRQAEVRLRSGTVLGFDVASQTPSALVAFGDLIDPEFAFLRAVARPDWVVVDVGAAIGQFTIFAATLPVAVVHAYEPDRSSVATLDRNIARNGVADIVRVHETALSSFDGEAAFSSEGPTYVRGLARERTAQDTIVPVRSFAGEMRRLGLDRVSLFKLNVAGFEPDVLDGARSYLAEARVDVMILLLGLKSLPYYEELSSFGYRFFYYHPKDLALYEIGGFDEAAVLHHRPWPARHIIAIHADAVVKCVGDAVALRKF